MRESVTHYLNSTESGGERAAVQALREVRGRPAVAKSSARVFSTAFGRGEGFKTTGLAEIRLGALESDLSRRNKVKADEGGRRRENWRASLRLRTLATWR
jgi:hypothetical protein